MCDICVLTKQCVTYAAMVFSCLYCPEQSFSPQTCTLNCGRREITGYSYKICKDMARCAPRTPGEPTWSNMLWEPPWALALISCFAVKHPGVLGLAPGRPSLADCATSCYCVLPLHLLCTWKRVSYVLSNLTVSTPTSPSSSTWELEWRCWW